MNKYLFLVHGLREKSYTGKLTAVRIKMYRPSGGFCAPSFGKMADSPASTRNFFTMGTINSDWYFPWGY
jgi:hypothetical protein